MKKKLKINMREKPAKITWIPSVDCITIKLDNSEVDLALDLGPDAIRQLKQALAWENNKPAVA